MDLKSKTSYKYKDDICRLCGVEEETLSHATNCGHDEKLTFDVTNLAEIDSANSRRCIHRIETFLEKVSEQ